MLLSKHISDTNYAVETYNETIEAIVDKHAPLTTRIVTVRPHTPWYNDSIRATKCLRRQLERRWRTTGRECDGLAYCLSVSLLHHPYTVRNWNTTRVKSLMHLVTRKSCSRLSPRSYTPFMTLHFRHVTHSMRVSNVDIYTDGESHTCLLNAFEPATETEIGILLK